MRSLCMLAFAALMGQAMSAVAEPRPVTEMAPANVLRKSEPPETPAAPRLGTTFIIFFDHKSADLTAEALAVLNEAAAAARGHRMRVVAHCDTAEDSMDLTVRRAWTVREALGALGYPVLDATFVPRGSADLLVPTPRGVREPQNRRVTIDILP